MQRQVADFIAVDLEGFLDHGVALGLVGLGADLHRQVVELGVAVAAKVELAGAGLVVGAAHQGVQRVVRVVGGWRPAQHVEAGVAAQDFREVGALGLGLQVDLDVDARQVGGHRLADLRVVHVTIVRAVHGDFEAAAVAGIGHQLLGGFHVVG